jgi:type III pantothenate kinase
MDAIALIDVGNTRTKVALSNGKEISDFREIPTVQQVEIPSFLDNIDSWVLSSVVPDVGEEWKKALSKRARGLSVKDAVNFDVIFDVSKKAEVGEDRIADIEGCFFLGVEPPFITIDYGTASVINVVTPDGEFIGGAIGPGVVSSFECLISKAALLEYVELSVPKDIVGRDTKTNLDSGFIFGFAFWAEGFYQHLKEVYPGLKAIMTGGAGKLIKEITSFPVDYVSNLSLLGLMRILELNKSLL